MCGSLAEEVRWWDVCKPGVSEFKGGYVSETVEAEETSILKALHFSKWKTFEDEFISFEYPDHEKIVLKVNKSQEEINVEGGVVTSVDNSYSQSYVLNVGESTFGVFLLNPSEWLDDGICMCGPMVHHAYKIDNGTLTRFSMLPGGAVKKAQVIGGGLRFMAFEWTHLSCSRPVYERMVASMKIKSQFSQGDDFLRKELIKRYGDDAKVGLIARNSSTEALLKEFGEPSKKSNEGVWSWSWVGEEYPSELNAQIKDGKLIYFQDDGISKDYKNPVRGSMPWCRKYIKDLEKNETDNILDPNDDQELFRTEITNFLKNTSVESNEWFNSLLLIEDAFKLDIKDDSWVQLILNKSKGDIGSADYLKQASPDTYANWAFQKIKDQVTQESSALNYRERSNLVDGLTKNEQKEWRNLALEIWEKEKSELRYLALKRPDLQDPLLVEKHALAALKLDIKIDDGLLAYYSMEAISTIDAKNKDQLLELIKKLPEGSEYSTWSEMREKTIKHLLK